MAHGEQAEGVVLAVAGVAVGRKDDAQGVGVGAARDDVVCDEFLVEIFHRWPDVEKWHGYVGRCGYDAARGEELL